MGCDSVFLAIKHASAAMKVTNPSKGKEFGGGSIILTASGELVVESVTAKYITLFLQWLVYDLELVPLIVSCCPTLHVFCINADSQTAQAKLRE